MVQNVRNRFSQPKIEGEINNISDNSAITMPVIQVTISQGRSVEQKRELVKVLTRETARIMKTDEEKVRILIYEVSKENWGNAGIL
ncbi:MAG TPA: tautomerase family protein, partial [Nitrososphaeraceae archaeon]|nr:tautomerase family protein [Nitrososphaeraceae archaeon]